MAQVSGPQWAPDPYGRYELRFWDGSTWTEHVSRHGVQARDPLAPVAPVVPVVPVVQERAFGQEPFAELLPRSPGRAAGVPGHTRQGAGSAKAPRRKAVPVLLAAGAAAAVIALVASLGGGPSTPTASSTTDSIQPLAAVPTQTSSTTAKAAPSASKATSRTTTKAAAKKTSPTTTEATTTTTSKKPRTTTTTRAKASTTRPRSTTSTRPRTTTSTKPAAKDYANCTALNADYPHGVGRSGAVDQTSGTPVTTFTRNNALYEANAGSDRDKDGIACEKR